MTHSLGAAGDPVKYSMNILESYRPITATPFKKNESYIEVEPCAELKPYIRCFWGSKRTFIQPKTDIDTSDIVIPDTCMDIIFDINFTDNIIYGNFVGIDDRTFFTHSKNDRELELSVFGIRFYAWSAILFAEENMKEAYNSFTDVQYYFSKLKKELEAKLFDLITLEERVALTQKFLLRYLHRRTVKPLFMEAVGEIVYKKGNVKALQLAKELHISSRQLERIFKEQVGVSPKKLASLVRYQCLWNDAVYRTDFHIQDEVHELGYVDQAHLLNDFRNFHTMSLTAAKQFAVKSK